MLYLTAGRGGPQYALRDGDWKIVAFTEPLNKERSVIEHIKDANVVKFELYDLRKDEKEATDLSVREPEVFERMKQAFLKLHKEVLNEGRSGIWKNTGTKLGLLGPP